VSPARDFRDVVAAKRDGRQLPDEDVQDFVLAYARGEVGEELAAAFLMAAYLNGLSPKETAALTAAMVASGSTLPLSGVSRPKVDKHSTGGVGDGVTLLFAPLAASLGLAVAKLSGRGLGHTGGTLDKLESIPGFRTDLSPGDLERQVEEIGCAVAAQTKDLVPADGALYALREATATVGSVPLIAASVMSKKLAVGTDLILLDVKWGSGAFMKTPEAARDLARACIELAAVHGRAMRAAVSDMSQPLGRAVGNALEVAEAVAVLKGEQAGRLWELTASFGVEALVTLQGLGPEAARKEVERAVESGEALEAMASMIRSQGGDPAVVERPWDVLPRAPVIREVGASAAGWLASTDAEALGRAAVGLGAGRLRKGDPIDPAVGFEFVPNVGDQLEEGQPISFVHARDEAAADRAGHDIQAAVEISPARPEPPPLVLEWDGTNGSST
jgi:pyrimidine-nucleoside phosphorylase